MFLPICGGNLYPARQVYFVQPPPPPKKKRKKKDCENEMEGVFQ